MPGIGIGISPFLSSYYGGVVSPVAIGRVLTPTYDSGDYSSVGAVSPVYNGSTIRLKGTDGAVFGKYIYYNQWYTGRTESTIEITNYLANVSGTSIGFGPMLEGALGSSTYQTIGVLGLESGGNKGNLYIMGASGGTPAILVQTGAGTLAVNNNDSLTMRLTRDQNVITFTVVNNTQSITQSVSFTLNYNYPFTDMITPSAKIGFYFFGGDHTFNWGLTTTEVNRTDLQIGGTSKTMGYFVTGTANDKDVVDLWRIDNPTKYCYHNAGVNETTADWLNKLPEILQNRARVFIIEGPCNDVRFGVSGATIQAHLTTLKNALEANGSTVYYQSAPPENTLLSGIDLSSLIPIAAAVFDPSKIIPVPPTWNTVTDNTAEGVHWTQGANLKIKNNQALYITL